VRAASDSQPATPTLVVFITVDQLRPDYFDRYAQQLTGGLRRLASGGAFFTNAHHDHGITETAPGHSVTLSGRFQRSTGIVRNNAGVQDPQAPLIGGGGEGASPFRFRGSTLVDWLRLKDPRSRALSVSRKDRGAILPVGRAPQAVFWYAADSGRFTTSTYYHDTLPSWVTRFNARRLPQSFAGKVWTPLLPAREYRERDSVAVESRGQNFAFPHPFPSDSLQAAQALPAYPQMDSVTLAFALDGLTAMQLGSGPQTDVLAVSLSTTDAVGHRFGPDSRELHDQILRLDRALGAFLDSLYRVRDSARVVIAFTADHGVAPFPQLHFAGKRGAAAFADLSPLVARYGQALDARGLDSTAFDFEYGAVFVDRPALTRAGVDPDSLLRAFAADARKVPGVLRVDLVRELATADTARDPVARRWYHALPPDLPAAAVVTLQPYVYWAGVTYATHGSPHDYDAHVPVILYGSAIKPGRYTTPARVVDLAPTLAALTGTVPTERLDGRVLQEALKTERVAGRP
jgi:predicted AlkP superfamily pyrophosphatase or phosphodiesterase